MRTLTIFCSLVFFSSISLLHAQKVDTIAQQEINQLIWKPFMESYNNLDAEGFNQLHADDVLRAGSWSIREGEEYKESNRKGFARTKEGGTNRTIELRFDFRKTTEHISYETGFYKVVSQAPNEEARTFYGYFHVVIKKNNGKWLITQDWDDGQFNGQPITEQHFLKAKPLVIKSE